MNLLIIHTEFGIRDIFLSTVLGTLSRFIIRDNVPNTETLYILVGIISQEIENI